MPLDTGCFDLHRTLPLGPDRLWQVLTDPHHRETWGAPSEDEVLVMESADLRVGGQDRHRCGPAEAPDWVVLTRWYRLEAPHLAIFTETLMVGEACHFVSLVTYGLVPSGDATDLTVNVAISSFDGPHAAASVRAGWEGGLFNLLRLCTLLKENDR